MQKVCPNFSAVMKGEFILQSTVRKTTIGIIKGSVKIYLITKTRKMMR